MGTPKGTVPHNAGKGEGWVDPRGYRVHSRAINGKRQQVREHRAVMESVLGRTLEPWELVHHKDGNPTNNAPANLELMTFGEHTAQHHTGARKSYEARRSMEAFANMREELKRVRSVNADLLAALRGVLDMIAERARSANHAYADQRIATARDAIAKAEGK